MEWTRGLQGSGVKELVVAEEGDQLESGSDNEVGRSASYSSRSLLLECTVILFQLNHVDG